MTATSYSVVCCLLAGVLWTAEGTTLADRSLCRVGDVAPPSRVNTTGRLADFRDSMAKVTIQSRGIAAMIVGSSDAHNSEYPTKHDEIRAYISGFGGSVGTAVITQTEAALWVDGRYYLEADEVLDCNWILMKDGLADTPSVTEWINSKMASTGLFVGVDPRLITHTAFTEMNNELALLSKKPELKEVDSSNNPINTWTDRPDQPTESINAIKTKFAGKTWQDKIAELRKELTSKSAVAYVVTSLDETAWLFNLRGSDVAYNPFFLSYAIVEANKIRLYILDKTNRLVAQPTDSESDQTLSAHLASSNTGTCTGSGVCVEVVDYDERQLLSDLSSLAGTGKVWISYQASYSISSAISSNRLIEKSPIALVKSQKNSVERTGMTTSHNRDSTALIKFLAFLEKEIADGNRWTEVTAAAELDKRRGALTYNRGLSFETISGYGSNGAVIHYRPNNDTDKVISTDSLYLLDSGGQYLDGTTDVTRTMHFGTPTDYQKECYTRVLSSAINLAMLKWPEGIYGYQIDAITRQELWEAGLVYRHGTGHGIGAYLSVHEGPGRISMTTSPSKSDQPLSVYQYFSDEPGYYEDNSFGIRLETIVTITSYTPVYNTSGENFLAFKAVTLVPFETKLIDYSRMTSKQVEWLNDYNSKIRTDILPLLTGDQLAIDWVNSRTGNVSPDVTCQGAEAIYPTAVILVSTIYTLFTALNA